MRKVNLLMLAVAGLASPYSFNKVSLKIAGN
jgi:hypothetical protein